MNDKLTDEQLWLLCQEYEKELKAKREQDKQVRDNYRDKAVDWEYWQMMYAKGKDLK